MNILIIRAIFAATLIAVLLLFLRFGAEWVGAPAFLPDYTIEERVFSALFLESIANQIDRILNLLLSLLIGVCAVGALSMQRIGTRTQITAFHLGIGLGFVVAAFLAAYFMYAARQHTLTLVEHGYVRFDNAVQIIGRAAFFVALAASGAVLIAVEGVLPRRTTTVPLTHQPNSIDLEGSDKKMSTPLIVETPITSPTHTEKSPQADDANSVLHREISTDG